MGDRSTSPAKEGKYRSEDEDQGKQKAKEKFRNKYQMRGRRKQ